MNKRLTPADDQFFQGLADREVTAAAVPARLKSRIYSTLVRKSQEKAPLRGLSDTRRAGYELCLWEKVMETVPRVGSVNHCRLCHARLMAESLPHAPLGWSGCPYAEFHRR